MKDIRPALRTWLLADNTVNGLVGGERIQYGRLRQDEVRPSVVYSRISEQGQLVMEGDDGLMAARFQFDSWAQTLSASDELARAVHTRLSGAKGEMMGDSGPIQVRGIIHFNGRDDYDPVSNLYRVSRDYVVWYGARD